MIPTLEIFLWKGAVSAKIEVNKTYEGQAREAYPFCMLMIHHG